MISMWFFIATFALSLFGLFLLFFFKIREDHGQPSWFLFQLRRVGDPFFSRHAGVMRHFLSQGLYRSVGSATAWHRGLLTRAEASFFSAAHAFTARLHEYLLRRKTKINNENGTVSPHLKNVLEYKEEEKDGE